MSRLPIRILVIVLLLGAAGTAWGQADRPRSDTGRHKPAPPPPPVDEKGQMLPVPPPTRWFAGLGGGLMGGSDIWRVKTVAEVPVAWESLVPFTSERFGASLDRDLSFGFFVGRRLGDRWSLRADVGVSRMDVAAEALQGQQGAVFLYDRMTAATVAVTAEARLVRLASYPYLAAGPVLMRLTSGAWDALAQTRLGAQVTAGYLKSLGPEFSLRGEVRYLRSGFDSGDFVPQTTGPAQPVIEFVPNGHLDLFSWVLALEMNL